MVFETSGFENSLNFYQQIIPLIFHKNRSKIANTIFNSTDFKSKLTIKLSENIKDLFRKLRKEKLDTELMKNGSKYKYIKSLRSIESWTYPSKFGKIRSVYIYYACKLLNKDPNTYIPLNQLKLIENIQK